MSSVNPYQQLSEPFAPEMERTMSKGGTRLVYIPVSEVINRLNKVLGVERWSFEIISCSRDAIDPDYVVAHVRLTWNPDDDHAYVQRDGFGGQKIKRTKSGDIVDLGDEMKGAVSDALKKAAQTLGVGLYLARSEEAMDIEDAMDAMPTQPEIDVEILAKWDKFTALVKDLTDTQKSELNSFWANFSGGKPKPTKATATHESLDALIAETVRLSFGGEYAEPAN
jgi:hypothetical protein